MYGPLSLRGPSVFCESHDPAADPGPCVPRGLAQLVSSLPEVVGIGVDDKGTADDAAGTGEGYHAVSDVDLEDFAVSV